MAKPSVIVIGAGLGGLSTGTYAQMNGYQCQIFEHGRINAKASGYQQVVGHT